MDKEKLQRVLGLFLDAMRPYVVSVYDDGFCECNGCGYQWYEE